MRNRSLFWPFFLIATGIVWLLVELRTIPLENLWALMYIWPFFLMAAGVGLILRSRWPVINDVRLGPDRSGDGPVGRLCPPVGLEQGARLGLFPPR